MPGGSADASAAEVCDYLDNDCDASTDEDYDVGASCGTGDCSGGSKECKPDTTGTRCDTMPGGSGDTSAADVCDSLDNDCDGSTDEDYDVGAGCGTGQCSGGAKECTPDATGTRCDTMPGGSGDASSSESCDDVDNDCDAQTDEGFSLGAVCGVGECAGGGLECLPDGSGTRCDTMPGGSADASAADVCDYKDNDCDAQTDEDYDVGDVCGTGDCSGGAKECLPDGSGTRCDSMPGGSGSSASGEVCDAEDNDCDGSTDEDFDLGAACGVGECSGGAKECKPDTTGTRCDTMPGGSKDKSATDFCDSLDNDCDASTDEDYDVGVICGTGQCSDGAKECDAFGTGTRCDTMPNGSNDQSGAEICDDVDNDCDAFTDEGFDLGAACGTGQCSGGAKECEPDGSGTRCDTMPGGSADASSGDVCDSVDNDCDSATDEDYDVGDVCGTGDCSGGAKECLPDTTGTRCDTMPGGSNDASEAEVCDAADNDCDSATDEDFDLGAACGTGDCSGGAKECKPDGSGTRCDTMPGGSSDASSAEACDAADNDCDSATDEDFDLGAACGVGECVGGVKECKADGSGTQCDSMPGGSGDGATAEVCDYLDNDCDGTSDEGFTYTQSGFTSGVGESCDGVGECGVGQVECASETETTCSTNPDGSNPQVQPELCDYKDNDCDGAVDDGIAYGAGGPAVGEPCDGVGECGPGVVECKMATFTAICSTDIDGSDTEVTAELCDSLDNDCDTLIDEDFFYDDPVTSLSRAIGKSCFGFGACGLGKVECQDLSSATCSTNPGQSEDKAEPEVCNFQDDDCDQLVDEDDAEDPLTQSCYTGPPVTEDVGECHGGIQTCVSGLFGVCAGQVTPTAADGECDGLDEDCNGDTDEDYLEITCGIGACEAVSRCIGGVEFPCVPGLPTPDDQCDGIDNDCDGLTDEHYLAPTCGTGVCASIAACVAGIEYPCVEGSPTLVPETMNCDKLDNDCDGSTDELYDDGVACTISTCTGGVASDIPDNGFCDDSEPCTDDLCHPELDCVSLPDNTNAPDPEVMDDNPCTDLVCFGGSSQNVPSDANVPDDGHYCTFDYCVSGTQHHDIITGTCFIDELCYDEGETDPSDTCGVCYPDESDVEFSSTVYREHFDTGPATDWAFDLLDGSTVGWQLDNTRSWTAPTALYFGDPSGQTYDNGQHVHAQATSPVFSIPGGDVVTLLDFRLWLETESFNQAIAYDVLFVEVVRQDGAVDTIWNSVEGMNGNSAGTFRHVQIPLGAYVGEEIQVRYRFDSGDHLFNDYEGAYVDAMELVTTCCTVHADCDDADDTCTIDSCQSGKCNYIHTCDDCAPTPVNMLVLLDFSGSMNWAAGASSSQSKWEVASGALASTLQTFGAVLNTGLKLFKTPGMSSCSVNQSSLELPFHSSAADFNAYLASKTPSGSTPMGAGLYGALNVYDQSGLSGTKYVLLITDGVETCGGDPVAAVTDLYAAGVEVYVVGFDPDGNGVDHGVLNAMAEAGGHAIEVESAAESAYYRATTEDELDNAILDIFGEASGEQCNNVDDDCDGLTDEGVKPIACNIDCGTHGVAGKQFCSDGLWSDCTVNPDAELCNGLDDDCNGVVDDNWTDAIGDALGETCTVGVGACEAQGVFICPPDGVGEPVCDATPGAPTDEVCDNVDNNCNGLVDDGLNQDCSTACGDGIEQCIAGNWVACDAPPVLPDDQCNDIDDDCDGTTDPLFPELGADCDGADADLCAYGTWTCSFGQQSSECVNENPAGVLEVCDDGLTDEDCDGAFDEEDAVGCTQYWYDLDGDGYGDGDPRCLCVPDGDWDATEDGDCNDDDDNAFPGNPEQCDDVDNDCNGVSDEDPDDPGQPIRVSCYDGPDGTVGVGSCSTGLQTCYDGDFGPCMGQITPQDEECNGLDDDCDGLEDSCALGDPSCSAEPGVDGLLPDDHPCETFPGCFGDAGTLCSCTPHPTQPTWVCAPD